MHETDMAGKDARRSAKRIQHYAECVEYDAVEHGLYDGMKERPEAAERWNGSQWVVTKQQDVANWRKELLHHVLREVHEAGQATMDDDHFAEQLADIILVTMSVAVHCGINIGEQVERKRLKNIFRPYGHGEGKSNG